MPNPASPDDQTSSDSAKGASPAGANLPSADSLASMQFTGRFRASAESNDDKPAYSNDQLREASRQFLEGVQDNEQRKFNRFAQEMSFAQFMAELFKNPTQFIRNAPQYTVDAFDAYGSKERVILGRKILDFNIKNWPWQSDRVSRPTELVGQEIPLYDFYKANQLFAREPHPTRMIMFHGPPGGGKTLLAETIDAALEDYSRNHPAGSMYRLILVFSGKDRERIGFDRDFKLEQVKGDDKDGRPKERYVFRPEGNTDPIFLISKDIPVTAEGAPAQSSAREALFERLVQMGRIAPDFPCKDYLLRGELDSTTERLMEELLRTYDGDLAKVISNHVRVERWHYSSKTGRGLSSVKPNHDWASDIEPLYPQQMFHQSSAPDELQGVEREMYQARAIALSTNRGHLHYADLLRPNERDRGEQDIARLSYLLEMIEGGEVQIMARGRPALVRTECINTVIRADSNDIHIRAKSQGSAWEAFRQRCNFITVGLTTRYLEEARAHKEYLTTLLGQEGALAPHALSTFALFVTATRLLNPRKDHYDGYHEDLPGLVDKLSVVEKALLLQEPKGGENIDMNILRERADRYSAAQLRLFKRFLNVIASEYQLGVGETRFSLYEGGLGISTRAAQDLLRDIVKAASRNKITALDVLDYLDKRVKASSLEYYQQVAESKAAIEKQMVEGEVLEAQRRGESLDERRKAEITKKVRERIEKLYPVPDPDTLLSDVAKFARKHILNDLYHAIGIVDSGARELSLRKYIEHVRAQRTGQAVREEHRTLHGRDAHKPDTALMEDFEDRVAQRDTPQKDFDRERFRQKLLTDLGSWRTEHPTDEIEGNLENIFPNLMAGIRHVQEDSLKKALGRFVEDTKRYANNSERILEDSAGDTEARKRVRDWQSIAGKLEQLGYPSETIARHVVWATRYIQLSDSSGGS